MPVPASGDTNGAIGAPHWKHTYAGDERRLINKFETENKARIFNEVRNAYENLYAAEKTGNEDQVFAIKERIDRLYKPYPELEKPDLAQSLFKDTVFPQLEKPSAITRALKALGERIVPTAPPIHTLPGEQRRPRLTPEELRFNEAPVNPFIPGPPALSQTQFTETANEYARKIQNARFQKAVDRRVLEELAAHRARRGVPVRPVRPVRPRIKEEEKEQEIPFNPRPKFNFTPANPSLSIVPHPARTYAPAASSNSPGTPSTPDILVSPTTSPGIPGPNPLVRALTIPTLPEFFRDKENALKYASKNHLGDVAEAYGLTPADFNPRAKTWKSIDNDQVIARLRKSDEYNKFVLAEYAKRYPSVGHGIRRGRGRQPVHNQLVARGNGFQVKKIYGMGRQPAAKRNRMAILSGEIGAGNNAPRVAAGLRRLRRR